MALSIGQECAKQGQRNREGAAQDERVGVRGGSVRARGSGEEGDGSQGQIVGFVRPTMYYHNPLFPSMHECQSHPPRTTAYHSPLVKPLCPTPHVILKNNARLLLPLHRALDIPRWEVSACDNQSGEALRRGVG
jgi:hypothetical protein